MSKETHLWLVEYTGHDVPGPGPEVPEDWIVVGDTHWFIADCNLDNIENRLRGEVHWKVRGQPGSGRWIGTWGDEVYIADGCVVDDPLDVLRALGIEIDDYAREYYDDLMPSF